MEPTHPGKQASPEALVAEIFESCGYEVQQAVGLDPGTIDWYATPRTGFIRPRTYFRVLERCPESVEVGLAELDAARRARRADRAVAIVLQGPLPEGYAPDLAEQMSNVLTFRRWLLELSGIADEIRSQAMRYEREHLQEEYLPRRAQLDSGDIVSIDSFIDSWIERPDRRMLVVDGPALCGKSTVISHAQLRAAVRFAANPEAATPMIDYQYDSNIDWASWRALDSGFVVPIVRHAWGSDHTGREQRWMSLVELPDAQWLESASVEVIRLRLLPPSSDEVMCWLGERLRKHEMAAMVARARADNPDFLALSDALPNLNPIVKAIKQCPNPVSHNSLDAWIAAVVAAYVTTSHLLGSTLRSRTSALSKNLENAALREFAVGLPQILIRGILLNDPITLTWFDPETNRFRNNLIRDYFLARKVTREFELGNAEILLRYQFPPFVFIFLTLQSPDVAAQLTQGAVARLEDAVEAEVGRKLHLTFAHLLNRPVGVMQTHLREIREQIGKQRASVLAKSFQRIDEELGYLQSLSERTRLWQTPLDESVGEVPLRSIIDEVSSHLLQRYPAVKLSVDMAPAVRVRAIPDGLLEVMQCLLENAFHAALARAAGGDPQVTVSTRQIGDVLRIEVRDNGDGVALEDRERIFKPLVSTKKGGTGKPRGTGLGLAIARRYAEDMHGRVGLDDNHEETCFFVDLVLWRDSP